MYYVYSKNLKSGRTTFLKTFNSAEDAIHHIAKCYRVDGELLMLGENYYYMVGR